MKIGVSSYSFSKYMRETGANYFKIADLAKEMGFEGIEFIDLNLEVQPAESQVALAKEIRAYCDSIGLEVVAYTISADFIDRENEVERLKGQVDVAEALAEDRKRLLDQSMKLLESPRKRLFGPWAGR